MIEYVAATGWIIAGGAVLSARLLHIKVKRGLRRAEILSDQLYGSERKAARYKAECDEYHAQRIAAGRASARARHERALAARAERERATAAALATCTIAPREQVVADVIPARKARQNSSAGADATKEG